MKNLNLENNSLENIFNAAKNKLAGHYYYEKQNLLQRARYLKTCKREITFPDFLIWLESDTFQDCVHKINCNILPKSINKDENTEGEVIYNNYSENKAENIIIDSVNCFIECDYLILLLDTFWTLTIGYYVDSKLLISNAYGNRVERKINTKRIFEYYPPKYQAWYKNAFKKARENYKNKENSTIINLDIAQFYYNVNTDFTEFEDLIYDTASLFTYEVENINILKKTNNKLSEVYAHYHDLLYNLRLFDMSDGLDKKYILPIGLFSSSVIANYHLNIYDKKIIHEKKVLYYGRYVDDILIVISNHPSKDVQIAKLSNSICLEERGGKYYLEGRQNFIFKKIKYESFT